MIYFDYIHFSYFTRQGAIELLHLKVFDNSISPTNVTVGRIASDCILVLTNQEKIRQNDELKRKRIENFQNIKNSLKNQLDFIIINENYNSILEIMAMNIPTFVSRLPSTEEYLGKDYPMFFNTKEDVEKVINNKSNMFTLYETTYQYLKKIDKSDLSIETFRKNVVDFCLS
jgi:hypothetical protein